MNDRNFFEELTPPKDFLGLVFENDLLFEKKNRTMCLEICVFNDRENF